MRTRARDRGREGRAREKERPGVGVDRRTGEWEAGD